MLDMATVSSAYNFDNTMIKQVIGLQCQTNSGIPQGVLSTLNAFQQELRPYSQITTPAWLQELKSFVAVQNTWKAPDLQTVGQSIQRICDVWSPVMQTITRQQYQKWAIPQIETTMLDLIQSSCSNLKHDAMVSTLAGSLGALANLDIPEYDPTADISELTDEETAQLKVELSEVAEEPQNWQQRLMAVIQSWKERNPIIAGIILLIATAVISQLIGDAVHWAKTMAKDSLLREEPTRKAAVVRQIKKGETITVVADAPYYYQVEVTNPDTGECFTGYISKRSVDLENDTSDQS